MGKVKVFKSFMSEKIFVFSPAKTGSSYITSLYNTTGHSHSFFSERVYFYSDVKFNKTIRLVNRLLFEFFVYLKRLKNFILQSESTVLVPLRNEDKRLPSLLRDLLIPLANRYYSTKEYRDIHHSSKDEVIDFYNSKLNRYGLQQWFKDHNFPSEKLSSISENPNVEFHTMKKGTVSFIFFNINSFENAALQCKLKDLNVISSADCSKLNRNKSSDLWYSELFK